MAKQGKSGNSITTEKNRRTGLTEQTEERCCLTQYELVRFACKIKGRAEHLAFYVCSLLLLICLLPVGCKNKKNLFLHAYENNLGIKPSKLAQIDTVHFTTIQWENPHINFGKVKEGDSVTVIFRCRNTGENPLFLSEIYSPCGCTVPRYTEKVILPGELEELPVLFHTIGQDKLVHKKIIVTSNTSNGAKHTLLFEGEITGEVKHFE